MDAAVQKTRMKIDRIDAPSAAPVSAPGAAAGPGRGNGLFADSICKSFRGRPVVANVSLKLARGEVAGLLGPNGAGKTTCF